MEEMNLTDDVRTFVALFVEFDEMGFAPTTTCPNPEEYAKALAETFVENGYRKIHEGAVVLTREQAETFIHIKDLFGDFNDEITWEDFIELMDDIKKDTRKETADKFALKLADYFVERCGGKLCISLTLQEWYKMIDEICKEIIGGTDDDTSQAGK